MAHTTGRKLSFPIPFRKWLMVGKCRMWQGRTLLHFYFQRQSGGKQTPKQTKQHLQVAALFSSLARSMRPPQTGGSAVGASSAVLPSALSRTPHAPSEAPGCQICPLPMGAWSLVVSGSILRPSTRKGQAQCWPWAQPIHQSSSGLPPPQITSFPMLIPSEHYADCLYFCTGRTGC